jgi:hypothetical protein
LIPGSEFIRPNRYWYQWRFTSKIRWDIDLCR